jgi:hypothetical protein
LDTTGIHQRGGSVFVYRKDRASDQAKGSVFPSNERGSIGQQILAIGFMYIKPSFAMPSNVPNLNYADAFMLILWWFGQ